MPILLLICACASGTAHEVIHRRVPPDFTGHMQTWWADDRLREEGDYKEGRRNGHVRGYHPDGSAAFEGDFIDGVPTGKLEQHFPGGALALTEVVEAGAVQGPRTEYWPTGKVRATTAIVDGKKDGPEVQYTESGAPATAGSYSRGVPIGVWHSWDEQGRLTSETCYFRTGDQPAGYLETDFDTDGRISVQTRMLLDAGSWSGQVTMWYPSGRQAGLVEYRNGVRQGRDVSWDPEGRKRAEGQRLDDLRTGAWTFWDESGKVERTVAYDKDHEVR